MKENSVQFTSTWGRTMPPSPLALASVISRDTAHSSPRHRIGAEANKDPNIHEQVQIQFIFLTMCSKTMWWPLPPSGTCQFSIWKLEIRIKLSWEVFVKMCLPIGRERSRCDGYGLLSRWQRAILTPPLGQRKHTDLVIPRLNWWQESTHQRGRGEKWNGNALKSAQYVPMKSSPTAVSNVEIPIWNSTKLWSQRLVRVWASFSDRSVVGSLQWQANKLAYSVLSCTAQYKTPRTIYYMGLLTE